MILITIFLCIAMLVFLFLALPVRLSLKYKNGKMGAYVGILFLRFELYANKKQKINKSDFKIKRFRRRRDKAIKKYKLKKISPKSLKKEKAKKHRSPTALIRSVKLILWDAFTLFGRHLKFNKFRIALTVGGYDAAKTALNYGYTIQSLQYLVMFLEMKTNLDKATDKSARVDADFTSGKWDAEIDIVLSIGTVRLLKVGISALKGYLKYKNEENERKVKNGREQN